jgi:hypothetical protein
METSDGGGLATAPRRRRENSLYLLISQYRRLLGEEERAAHLRDSILRFPFAARADTRLMDRAGPAGSCMCAPRTTRM